MIDFNFLEITPMGYALGWTIIHSIWQLILLVLVINFILRLLPKRSPNLRYLLLLTGMTGALLMACITFGKQWVKYSEEGVILMQSELATLSDATANPTIVPVGKSPWSVAWEEMSQRLEHLMPIITCGWLFGIFCSFLYLISGLLHLRHLRHTATPLRNREWPDRFVLLCRKMGVRQEVQLLVSELVPGPITFHFFKPVVLAPVGLFTGMSTEQVEALLLHELAHIRRNDFVVNLFQNLVEILFFYHPAIWWLSGKIREEREHCCDDLVMTIQKDPYIYAEALTRIPTPYFSLKKNLVMSAHKKKGLLSKRIFRLFGQYDEQPSVNRSILLAFLLIFFAFATQSFVYSDPAGQPEEAVAVSIVENLPATLDDFSPSELAMDTLPLYVVDGKILGVGVEEDLLPKAEEIERVEVFKGEAAQTKYGQKGANGVVEISTKQGGMKKIENAIARYKETFGSDEQLTKVVKGKVLDEAKNPLIGVSVLIKGTKTGTVTDFDGQFELRLEAVECAPLVFAYVGMKTEEVDAVCRGDQLDVLMKKDQENVWIEKAPGAGVEKASDAESDKQPLFVIDGEIQERSYTLEGTELTADRIETITVLKGEAAQKKYGKAAENGVVEITTKEGETDPNAPTIKLRQRAQGGDNPAKSNEWTIRPTVTEDSTVSGRVLMAGDQPVIGASILIKGTKTGTISDLEGNFRLRLPDPCATLVFSFIGVGTKEIENACWGQVVDILLEKDQDDPRVVLKQPAAPATENPDLASLKAFPNPAEDQVNVTFNLQKESQVRVGVFSLDGKLVEALTQGNLPAGPHNLTWNIGPNSSGMYLIQLEINGEKLNKSVVVEQ